MYYLAASAVVLGDVKISEDVSVWHQAVVRGDLAEIAIGRGSNIQDLCVVHVSTDVPVSIGEGVVVGHGCILHGCTIESNVLVGMGTIIMDRAIIGEGSVIGAGSLILEGTVIPPNSLVVGSPGKVIRETTEEQRVYTRDAAMRYIEEAKRAEGMRGVDGV